MGDSEIGPWRFNPTDRNKKTRAGGEIFWQMPTRLVGDGVLRMLWQAPVPPPRKEDRTAAWLRAHERACALLRSAPTARARGEARSAKRRAGGSGSPSSVLPVLALHTWPERGVARADHPDPRPDWTPYVYLSRDRIAAVSGLSNNAVESALVQLELQGLLKRKPLWPAKRLGRGDRPLTHYSLSATLFPRDAQDPWVKIPRRLLYAGHWASLHIGGCRHLYLTIAGLNPVRDEDAFLAVQVRDSDVAALDPEERAERLARARAGLPMPERVLMEATGIGSRSHLARMLKVLCTAPQPDRDAWWEPRLRSHLTEPAPPYVTADQAAAGGRTYRPTRGATEWTPSLDCVNLGPAEVFGFWWPDLAPAWQAVHHTPAQRKRMARWETQRDAEAA